MLNIASAKKISELIDNSNSLTIPIYQRPYTWKPKQVIQLLDDLKESFENTPSKPIYLIGTIIIFEDKNEKQIVDGQQRLTTIALILYVLGYKDMGLFNQIYNHTESELNLKANYNTIKNWIKNKEIAPDEFKNFVLENIWFVLINAPSQDEAFVFFDSQNSRGKPLEKYDLLKAHHLRYISDSDEKVSKECTVYWEKIDKEKNLGFLINRLLGRTRIWSRGKYGEVDILEEFKSQRINKNNDGFYKLNQYQQPPIFSKWRYIDREKYDADDGLEFIYRDIDVWQGTKRLKFVSESKKYLPFQIMQPLEGGEQFFWYIEKYNQLYKELFTGREQIPELFINLYKCFEDLSYNLGVTYIFEVFKACCLFYYDKFGSEQLVEFAICAEHQLSILRFRQSSVQNASINKFIREGNNIFEFINEAAFPEHIIRSILEATVGKYSQFKRDEKKNAIRNSYFDIFYQEKSGFYSKYQEQLNEYSIVKVKNKFKKEIYNG